MTTKKELTRQADNLEILALLARYLAMHPEIRFGQALWNLGILHWDQNKPEKVVANTYNEEPVSTLWHVKKALQTDS